MKLPAGRRIGGAAFALGVTFVIAALSRAPWSADPNQDAVVRLAWRYSSEYVEECRSLTAEELERLPQHMRRPQDCDRRLMPYRLQLWVDGRRILDQWVRGGGLRQDRPLSVMHEVRLPPGEHLLAVSWSPERPEQRQPQHVQTQLLLEAGDVVLITYDIDHRRLVARPPGGR